MKINFRKSKLHVGKGLRWDTRSSYGDRRIDKWSCFTDLGYLLVWTHPSNLEVLNFSSIEMTFFSLRLLIVNNINGLKKVRGHRGLEQILDELVDLYWDIFPRNEAVCVGIMLTYSLPLWHDRLLKSASYLVSGVIIVYLIFKLFQRKLSSDQQGFIC